MRIALVSDSHLAPRAVEFTANWRSAADWIAAGGFELAVHLGDITADAVGDPEELAAAREILCEVDTDFLFVPGNHDIGDNPSGPGHSPTHPVDPGCLAEYRACFGPDRWARAVGDWRLLGLNAQLLGTGSEEEAVLFDWLAEQSASSSGPVGLFLHKPLFRDDPRDPEPHIRYVPLAPRQRLLDLLAACDLRFVISGHAHQFRRFRCAGVEHFWMPSTAFVISDRHQEAIGDKVVATAELQIGVDGHHLALARPAGLAQLDLHDHPHVYPTLRAVNPV